MEQKKTHGKLSRWKKILTGAAVIAVILAGVYFGAAVYFRFHFMPGTRINGIDCSMKKPEEFQRELEKTVENYSENHLHNESGGDCGREGYLGMARL